MNKENIINGLKEEILKYVNDEEFLYFNDEIEFFEFFYKRYYFAFEDILKANNKNPNAIACEKWLRELKEDDDFFYMWDSVKEDYLYRKNNI